MGKYLPPVTFNNFVLGLNDKTANNLLNDMELAESLNVFVGPGYIEKRHGYVPFRNKEVSFLYDFYRNTGAVELLAVDGNDLLKDNGSDLLPVTMTNPLSLNAFKNHIKPFTDSAWELMNGATTSVRTDEKITFSSTFSTGVNLEYELDAYAVEDLKGKSCMWSMKTYSMTSSDGLMPLLIKTVSNPSWTTLTTMFADSANMSNKTLTMDFPSDTTAIKIEVHRDTSSANNQPITLEEMQLELGSVKTTYEPYEIVNNKTVKMITYNDRLMNDVVLIADGGRLKTYNGTEVKEVAAHTPTENELTDPGGNDLINLRKVRSIVINGERIYIVGHPTNKNRVSFCHIDPGLGYGVYDYFPATHFFDLGVDDNDEIIELKLFRGAVIVFCKRSVWAIFGDGRTANDYQIIKINVPTGCIAPGSITSVGNSIFYLSDTHIYALTSTEKDYISANVASENIEKTLQSISLSDKEQAVGIFYQDKYYLSFPSGLTVVFDNLLGNWTLFTNIKAKSFLNRSGVLYFAGEKLYKFDETVFNDDGAAITARFKLKNMDFTYPVQDKKFRRMWVVAKQYVEPTSTYKLSAIIDYKLVNINDIETDQSLVWGEGKWGKTYWGFKEVIRNELDLGKRGTNFQLIIENSNLDQPFTFYGVTFEFSVKRP